MNVHFLSHFKEGVILDDILEKNVYFSLSVSLVVHAFVVYKLSDSHVKNLISTFYIYFLLCKCILL